MLTGRYPFPSYQVAPNDLIFRVKNGLLNYNLLRRQDVSPDAQDLIHMMCKLNPEERIPAHEALRHPWLASTFKQSSCETQIVDALFRGEEFEFSPGV